MSRRMSCSLTIAAVRTRVKTVTRRESVTWGTLKPGDRLTLVEKAMGLPKGATQVRLADVEIVDVRVEPIMAVTADDIIREGFGHLGWTPLDFVIFWLRSHGYNPDTQRDVNCRRIEWRYLDEVG